ncbi:MAG: primosomal protein N' [Erysipelotrichia bacterium]|nr:primosomal protein N' [Erysipelotrichia bacterium]NCC53861.1 primosomal protein N' [Erysipelotrichia bacterium]
MKIAQVYIEYNNMAVDQCYTYLCGNHDVQVGMRVLVQFAHKTIVAFVYEVKEIDAEKLAQIPYEVKTIISLIDEKPLINDELFQLAKTMSKTCVAPMISCFQAMLPSKLKPKSSNHKIKQEVWVVYEQYVVFKTKQQQAAMAYIEEHKEMRRSEFNQLYKNQLPALLKSGAIYLDEREASATLQGVYEDCPVVLNKEQEQAVLTMQERQGFHVYLLHGVTGSGKSEVFLQMAKQELAKGKQVLFLVPEISLTPQMVKRVKARFGNEVAIYHSSLNNQEKYEQYRLVATHKVNIVVGTRSAIFMPFDHLGLIILDEEHDQSYKQDSTPKYHTRDMAIERGKYHDCKVILASATPSLESYARAIKKVYTLVKLTKRIYGDMPHTKLVNMKEAMQNGENFILSNALKQAIALRLERHEQVILLLNRRGYAPILRCMDCGYVVKCPHCDLALNYHKQSKEYKCHVCGYSEKSTYTCKQCGSSHLKFLGLGTQKLEEYVQQCFPRANIVRMDADTTTHKNAHEKLLARFEKEGDILVGTQMIAKGLDYENVTLVGILNGDALLNRSDYRSVELTFDLLVQASGRSGRGQKDGQVMIQVYDDHHYAIQCAIRHDYETFFKYEMRFRHLGNYPPYAYLGAMVLSSNNAQKAYEEINALLPMLEDKNIAVLGAVELLKMMDQYRYRVILKSKDQELIANKLYDAYKEHIKRKGKAKLEIDVNPYMLD